MVSLTWKLREIKEGRQLLGGRRKIKLSLDLETIISKEINFTPSRFMCSMYLDYLVKSVTCNFISHLPAYDKRNMCVGMEI